MKKSIVNRLSLVIICSFLLLFTLNSALMLYTVRGDSQEKMEQIMQSNTREMAQEIELTLESTLRYLETERRQLLTLYENGELTGDRILDMRYANLLANDFLIGSSILLNPGVVDVSTPRAKQFTTEDGYFVPYVYYSEGELIIEPVITFKGEAWYEDPLREKREILTDPYDYDTGSEVLQMVTLSLPIITEDGKVLGGMYTDFPLNFVSDVLESYSSEGSSQRAMTASGYIMGMYNAAADEIGQNLFDLYPAVRDVETRVQDGELVSEYEEVSGESALKTFVPIQVGDIAENWFVESTVPESTILSTFKNMLAQSIVAALLISLLLAAIVFYVLRKHLAPLKELESALTNTAQGDLTQQINNTKLADNEIGKVAQAYNDMGAQMTAIVSDVKEASNKMDTNAGQILHVMDDVAVATSNVTNAIADISKGAQEQASNLEHANTKVSMLGQLIDDVSGVSSLMTEHIHASFEQATQGKAEVEQLRQHSELTMVVNDELQAQMEQLVSQIDRIDTIMQTIQAIAGQTNLLALNAAIEAARAGDAGKGFAVVADEVRLLAEQSQKETENVQQTVQHILRASSETQQVVQKSVNIMHEQNAAVERTEQAFELQLQFSDRLDTEVKSLIRKLEVMVSEKETVLFDIENISSISVQSSATAESVVASAEEQHQEIEAVKAMVHELSTLAEELKAQTAKFRV